MFFNHPKKIPIWPFVLTGSLILLGVICVFIYNFIFSLSPEKLLQSDFVKKYAGENQEMLALAPRVLGFTEPYTYLVLFQNNTEIRPTGGFIGSYAVVTFDRGQMTIHKIEGSEALDRRTPANWKPVPPAPLSTYLGVSQWFFRDANWSPDFEISAEKVLELYKGEGGVNSQDIDAVIGVTPTVVEKLLEVTGDLTVQGVTFTPKNVTEILEYEVEYGYKDKDISFENRKQILGPFMLELARELKQSIFTDYNSFIDRMRNLAEERQIVIYAIDEDLEKEIEKYGWGGEIKRNDGDYLQWVDANLGALKTDHALKRTINYNLEPIEKGRYLATVTMLYEHQGNFDWRTSQYLTYSRLYVPKGSELVSVDGAMNKKREINNKLVDFGYEADKTWFGAFTSVRPQKSGTLTFKYILPDYLNDKIRSGNYELYIQKQSGTLEHGLTLNLNFGKSIKSATPEEDKNNWGDQIYSLRTDLKTDKEIKLKLE